MGLSDFGDSQIFTLPLHPPTEKQAGADLDTVADWVSQWKQVPWTRHARIQLEWQTRNWKILGTQQLPVRIKVHGATSMAGLAGNAGQWRNLVAAAKRLLQAWPKSNLEQTLPKLARALLKIDDTELTQLISVVNWLCKNPDSGILPRQLPVPGVDSKWLERHLGLVEGIHQALTAEENLGLSSAPAFFSAHILDRTLRGLRSEDPQYLSASIPDLARLPWQPRWVLIVENYQTLLALPQLTETIAVFGRGKHAPALAEVPWIRKAAHLLYWGDLDTHGMHILSLLRKKLPQTESILMDTETLRQHQLMTVIEPKPFQSSIGHLTAAELDVLTKIRAGNLRLEQERISLPYAESVLRQRIGTG
jgi:hypothetical protein